MTVSVEYLGMSNVIFIYYTGLDRKFTLGYKFDPALPELTLRCTCGGPVEQRQCWDCNAEYPDAPDYVRVPIYETDVATEIFDTQLHRWLTLFFDSEYECIIAAPLIRDNLLSFHRAIYASAKSFAEPAYHFSGSDAVREGFFQLVDKHTKIYEEMLKGHAETLG